MTSIRRKKRHSTKKTTNPADQINGKTIRIRMYRVGFGDCFLLSIPSTNDSSDRQFHILVDCGVHSQGDIGTIEEVVSNIAEVTDKKLAVIIATHAHQDHISGFGRFGDIFTDFQVGEIWLPWTWDETNKEALKIQKRHIALTEQLSQHFEALGARANPNSLNVIMNLKGNAHAIELLKSGFGNDKANVRYLRAGDVLEPEEIHIPGLFTRILGPPESEEFLAQMKPPSGQSYLRIVRGKVDVVSSIQPFAQKWRINRELNPTHLDVKEEKDLQKDISFPIDELAFALDQARNNESVVTFFKFRNKCLLFAGDAQYGNWRWWLENEQSADILSKINFFKIAHHGSHNATPKKALEGMSDGEFAAMVSTQSEPWESIPRPPLMARVNEKTRKHIVRSDWLSINGAPIPMAGAQPPTPSTIPKEFQKGDLWFDYVIKL
jgi:beta-lactamase superfamily II metal-dependent hydrolase